jgi:hypothetical protein
MAQQQTFDVWHNSRFLELFGRRRVAPPVIAAAAAALNTHGRARSVPQQAGGPPAAFQQPSTTPTAVWRISGILALAALLAALVARGVCCQSALLLPRHWRALEHEHGAKVEVSTFRVTGLKQAPGSCAVYGPLPPGYMAGCTIHKDIFGEPCPCPLSPHPSAQREGQSLQSHGDAAQARRQPAGPRTRQEAPGIGGQVPNQWGNPAHRPTGPCPSPHRPQIARTQAAYGNGGRPAPDF